MSHELEAVGELSKLKGLGAQSEKALNGVGILTKQDLQETGAVNAFVKLSREGDSKPSLNFLYAMAGALEDRHWTEIAKHEKARLLTELEGAYQLEQILHEEPDVE